MIKKIKIKRYLKHFDEFNPVVITQTAKEDFEFIMKFKINCF
jgi:hypothetical protein